MRHDERTVIGLALTVMLLCCGCAEFRQDTAHFGGYYLTSKVEHIGHRELKAQRVYLSDEYVIVEASLTRPTGKQSEVVGKRFLVASRKYFDSRLVATNAHYFRGMAMIPLTPLVRDDLLRAVAASNGWVLWPDTLGQVSAEPSIETLMHLLKRTSSAPSSFPPDAVHSRLGDKDIISCLYYPQTVNTAAFWQEREYLVYHPVPTALLKCLVVPPAMVIDTACLPVVGIVYVGAVFSHSHAHRP